MPVRWTGEYFVMENMKLFTVLYLRSRIAPLAGELREYEVTKEVGVSDSGGFGECYKGRLWGAYPVALKCLRTNANKVNSEKVRDSVTCVFDAQKRS
ncbi:hypothetical protein BOTBODRAFT_518844 [Botryobasidium botryosum FD-172 SS1]|uniref:Protein kinase domain-containing protein n=1 Tax=Botryobasidium botryosum (strain FD-172 SS1) TaxID=930990 RepID=A0A067MSI5_BOTB1|nr:hypothetical protein BOTBODRAFT_518844 [Botryobasidium botryosum FD-172 SS1]